MFNVKIVRMIQITNVNLKAMQKINTLYKKDPNNLGRVINEIDPQNEWVLTHGIATRKFDGTACAVISKTLYKRYDAKINKETGEYKRPVPVDAIPCQEADKITGHHPHWVMCDRSDPADKWHFEAFGSVELPEGTYELCGEKVQSNPEKIQGHQLISHTEHTFPNGVPTTFNGLKDFLTHVDVEGIVFHHSQDDRMCKIRKSDFGIKRVTH